MTWSHIYISFMPLSFFVAILVQRLGIKKESRKANAEDCAIIGILTIIWPIILIMLAYPLVNWALNFRQHTDPDVANLASIEEAKNLLRLYKIENTNLENENKSLQEELKKAKAVLPDGKQPPRKLDLL